MADFTKLNDAVNKNTTLVQQVVDLVKSDGVDQAAVDAVALQLQSNNTNLGTVLPVQPPV